MATETLDIYLHHSSYTTFQRPVTTCPSLGCSTPQNSGTVWRLHHTPLQQTAYLEGQRCINLLASKTLLQSFHNVSHSRLRGSQQSPHRVSLSFMNQIFLNIHILIVFISINGSKVFFIIRQDLFHH